MENKKISPILLQQLRLELNEAVKAVADKHGLSIHFGNATYQNLTATFKVEVGFASNDNYDSAKALWDANCRSLGLEPEDYGKEILLVGDKNTYKISGYNPKGRTNRIRITRTCDGKEFITDTLTVKTALAKTNPQKAASPAEEKAAAQEAQRKAKRDWDMNCWRIGMNPEDFGKTVLLQGTFYTICGIRPSAKVKTVIIRHTINGKEYVVGHEAVKQILAQPNT